MANVEIRGIKELLRLLGVARTLEILEPPMQRSVFYLQAPLEIYPAPPVGSTYRRQGIYGGSWTTTPINRTKDSLTITIGNRATYRGREYAPWVGSEQFQTRVHARTGWPTDQGVAESQLPTIIEEFEASVAAALRRGGLL